MQGLSLICAITNEMVIVRHDFGYDYFAVFFFFFFKFYKGPSGVILNCYLAPSVAVTYHAALRCLLLCSTVCHIIPLIWYAGRGWMQTYLLFSKFYY